jgi:hypothetical protein
METNESSKGFTLRIPLDASGIEGLTPDQPVKVVLKKRDGTTEETSVRFNKQGKGTANFSFTDHPGRLHMAIGPADASAEELLALQTLRRDLPTKLWAGRKELALAPLRIPPYYWYWWWRWCRTFTIRGQVLCPNGDPVPGATVCAYDVDWWFFWTSRQLVGCDTTDANGTFEITFRWCCGWWPWWWWHHRIWAIDPWLVKQISPVLQRTPGLQLARAGNQPSLSVFDNILGKDTAAARQALMAADVGRLERLRDRLLPKLPPAAELEALHIWPWWPWRPWWDCTPDIIFQVTQDCLAPGTVIVDEGAGDTRWNIPNPLDVTLVANDQACCRPICPDPPCEDEDCLVLTRVCWAPITSIGGNPGAPLDPAGYLNPGATIPGTIDYSGDRPFAGNVWVEKNFGDTLSVDYYEVKCSDDGGLTWNALPAGALVNFYRLWMEMVPGFPTGHQLFQWQEIDGHTVVESREHFEDHGGLGGWGASRFWLTHRDVVFVLDSARFTDGTYHFHVIGWHEALDGTLTQVGAGPLPLCGMETPNDLVLTFDNRLNPDPAHPTSPTHPCGAGTVHLCVTEPDTDFISVKIGGTEVGPCDVVDRVLDQTLEIEFLAHDPDGHLAAYDLKATYGENLAVNLLDRPSSTLETVPPAAPGVQVGPTYGQALDVAQGAVAPHWRGGRYKLTVSVGEAFPVPCCYQLELRAWKRTVVTCEDEYDHWNLSQYTIGVGVCPPPG